MQLLTRLLNKTYLIEELFTYNGETKHLYYEEGKPNDVIYRPMAGSVSNCLSFKLLKSLLT